MSEQKTLTLTEALSVATDSEQEEGAPVYTVVLHEMGRLVRLSCREAFFKGARAVLERLTAGDSPEAIRTALDQLEHPPQR